MIRQKEVLPDAVVEIDGRQVPYLTEDRFWEECGDIVKFVYLAGGGFTFQSRRYPKGPYESVTMGGVIQWWSHTQATSRPQPEQIAGLPEDPSPEEFEAALEAVEEPEPVES